MWRNRRVVISVISRVGLPRGDHSLGHEVRDWLLQNFGAGLADRSYEIALGYDARDLVVVSQDDDAANSMLHEQLCDIEQRLVFWQW